MLYYIQSCLSDNQGSQFWGSFFGAFFAFIFGLIAFFITNNISNKRERFIKHKNALVKLEQLLNIHLDEISMVKYGANDIKEILKKRALVASRLNKLKVMDEVTLELASIILLNKYFSYSRSIVRFNLDFSSINYSLKRFEDAFLSNVTVAESNKVYLLAAIDNSMESLGKLENSTKEFLVLVRLYLDRIKDCIPVVCGICEKYDFDIKKEELDIELIKLEKEMADK